MARTIGRVLLAWAEGIADATIAIGRRVGRLKGTTGGPTGVAALPVRAPSRVSRLPGRISHFTGRVINLPGSVGRSRERRLAALARQPLASLYDLHPEARSLAPRQLGLRTVAVEEIVGTAVAGPAQRGGDFLPLRPFRSANWEGRWQRIRRAVERLAVLPPVDLVRFGGGYWVEDGHNRVAAALYAGQLAIDASVTDLVPPGAALTEAPSSLAADLVGSARLRSAGEGRRPAIDVRTDE